MNALGRVTTISYATDAAEESLSTVQYNVHGNPVKLTDALGQITAQTFDALHRLVSRTHALGQVTRWNYDDAGNVLSETRPDGGVTTNAYDAANRLVWSRDPKGQTTTMDYDATGNLTNLVDANHHAYQFAYDLLNRRTRMTYPDGTMVTNRYTARGQLAAIQNGHPNPIVQYAYDAIGNRVSKTLDNHTVTTYAYDVANQLTTIRHQQSAAEFARFDYAYNAVGNRTSKQQTGGLAESYAYDAIDQLTGVLYTTNAVNERTVSYEYDPVGNRQTVTENGLPTTYSVNLLNQYDAFRYDANGNLTTHAGWTLTYDAQNRMIGASHGDTNVVFAYDARNRCVSRTVNGITTYFAYDGWNLIEDHDASGNVLARYYHGAGVDELIARATPTGTVYYHQDALGSTTHLTDSTGTIVESYRYDAFGLPLSASAVGNRFLFTGREWLSDLSLYDYRNRIYLPSLGRFMQPDPIGFDGDDVNLYRYCLNDPIRYIDPNGQFKLGNWWNRNLGRLNMAGCLAMAAKSYQNELQQAARELDNCLSCCPQCPLSDAKACIDNCARISYLSATMAATRYVYTSLYCMIPSLPVGGRWIQPPM